ncbi:MAG: extracellular solute-binding protein [Candidatus Electrothrix aestuarii]|uniref:Extracellular solute-binding protein n=1 Tax=Candidatus Electrothrix aestuarii TaxID=3062594 RepID=A0AAU8LV98_9BACT|nr:extracellular solute-binding protein [Candidatus Electrothrix aestuarii]WPD21964.1 MAG: extracellular solute-binding protein [Candidatus Electrothrix sp. GW3-3]
MNCNNKKYAWSKRLEQLYAKIKSFVTVWCTKERDVTPVFISPLNFIGCVVLAGCLLSAGCSSEDKGASSKRLLVYDWSACNLPQFYTKFTEKYLGSSPRFTYIGSDEEAYAKAVGGFTFDIIHPCSNFYHLYVESGLIQPLDTSRIERWDELVPSLKEAGKINGTQYIMPYDWGYESILVRTDKVKELPDSWADLWDPQYKGHVVLLGAADANHIIASLALGFDPWNTTPDQDEKIKQKLIELKPNVLSYWNDFEEIKQLIASGDAWLASSVWNDAYANLKAEGIPVEYIVPKEGRMGWGCGYAISSRTENLDLAYDYLNALLDPESHAAFGNMYAYGVSSKTALSLMDPEQVKIMQLDNMDIQSRTVFYRNWTEEQRKNITERWPQVQAAP